jgi:hypothetical protein
MILLPVRLPPAENQTLNARFSQLEPRLATGYNWKEDCETFSSQLDDQPPDEQLVTIDSRYEPLSNTRSGQRNMDGTSSELVLPKIRPVNVIVSSDIDFASVTCEFNGNGNFPHQAIPTGIAFDKQIIPIDSSSNMFLKLNGTVENIQSAGRQGAYSPVTSAAIPPKEDPEEDIIKVPPDKNWQLRTLNQKLGKSCKQFTQWVQLQQSCNCI